MPPFVKTEKHILPKGFKRIRHYGFLQNHGKRERLKTIRKAMKLSPLPETVKIPVAIRMLEKYGKDIFKCPCYPNGKLKIMGIYRYTSQTKDHQQVQKITDQKTRPPPFDME